MLAAWAESPAFSDREGAALAWTEALTLIAEGHVPAPVHEQAKVAFSDKELAYLTAAAVASDGWNRVAVALRFLPRDGAGRADLLPGGSVGMVATLFSAVPQEPAG